MTPRPTSTCRGKSGARHEFDVVGDPTASPAPTSTRRRVQGLGPPIDKDVVYKLRGELSEVGAARGVIVAPAGWTADAAAVASHLHIDLWGGRS